MSKYNTVYKITNMLNNKIYIGCHQTDNLNDNYMGSGKALHRAYKKYGIENFKKEILFVFNSFDEMFKKEAVLVNEEFIKREDTYNIMLGGKGFNTKGLVQVKDKDGNSSLVNKDDPRYLSGELVSCTTGLVIVKDKDGNKYSISKNDPRYLSGDLVGITKGNLTVKDKDGNNYYVSLDDPRYISGELVGITKGNLTVKDKDGNNYYVSLDDPRYISSELKFTWKGKKHTDETKRKIGESNKISQLGEKNSQYGTYWIHNITEKKSIRIKKDDLKKWLNKGWIKGRKMKFD